MTRILFLLISLLITKLSFAEGVKSLDNRINDFFVPIVDVIAKFIFWDPIAALGFNTGTSIPIVVVWLVFGALFFTFKMNFINIRAFKHAVDLVCGKYEGIDQRVIDAWKMEEISIGDYVLSGGEIAAMNLIGSCVRLLPNTLGSSKSLDSETFQNNLLEYPQYTKPRNWLGKRVPEVLLSGNHKKIKEWKEKESIKITRIKRPDLLKKVEKR